jgi:hypothetical protein
MSKKCMGNITHLNTLTLFNKWAEYMEGRLPNSCLISLHSTLYMSTKYIMYFCTVRSILYKKLVHVSIKYSTKVKSTHASLHY